MNRIKYDKIIFFLYPVGWVIVFMLPTRFHHVGGDNGVEGWILFFSLCIMLPYFLYQTLTGMGVSAEWKKGFAFGSIFLAIPFSLFMQYLSDKELEDYGQETSAIVSKAWILERPKRASVWNVQAKYEVNGIIYQTSSRNDKDKILSIGDSVLIIYSSKTPELCKVKELVDHYNSE